MASSSGGGDVPAEIKASAAAAAVSDLIVARDGAATLRTFLLQLDHQRAPWAQQVIEDVLNKVSSAMSVLVTSGGAAAEGPSPAAGSDGARPQQSVSSCANKRKQTGSSSRRSHRLCDKKITSTLEDGHVWRKYGQKEIQNSPYPRSYYRCTHKTDQGCSAKRYVQRCDDTDPSKHVVTYYGEHTCRDPSTIPLIVPAEAGDHRANNLISFGPASVTTTNNAAASTDATSSQAYLATMGGSTAAEQLSTSWCTSDDMFSSSAGSFMQVDELIGAVVGSAGVMSSATDRGRLGGVAGGGGTASFPPSPNSLGCFVVGSFGSIAGADDDDGMFPLDP